MFRQLFEAEYPIQRMQLVDNYGGDDLASMQANNTSAFNCREVAGKPGIWSNHALGLAVDEETGGVKREDGTVIPGLFAAGRTAVGVCSRQYISGLSIADCVFSGRRAGASAASSPKG